MWSFLLKLLGGGAASVIDSATGLTKVVIGDEAAAQAALSVEQTKTIDQYAAEFAPRAQRTWWDSLVDGLNRLIRPSLTIGVHLTFVWAAIDPVNFTITMQALAIVPDPLWLVWATIIAFYFGGRILEQAPKTWRIAPRALDLAREVVAQRTAAAAAAPPAPAPVPAPAPAPSSGPAAPRRDNGSDPLLAVAATIWGEARGEPPAGKTAVAWVIRNRVMQPGWWGRDWLDVCTRSAVNSRGVRVWQFSCWGDQQASRLHAVDESDRRFVECLAVARTVMSDSPPPDPTNGADHYYADTIATPRWAQGVAPTVVIGHHRFFRLGLDGRG